MWNYRVGILGSRHLWVFFAIGLLLEWSAKVFRQKAKNNYGKSEDLEIQGLHLAFGIRFHYAIVFLQTARNIYGRSGVAGHWSPYLSHAKRALYHLSYIPVWATLRRSLAQSATMRFFRRKSASVKKFQYVIVFCRVSLCNSFSADSEKHLRTLWSCGALIPVPLPCEASALPFELHPRLSDIA